MIWNELILKVTIALNHTLYLKSVYVFWYEFFLVQKVSLIFFLAVRVTKINVMFQYERSNSIFKSPAIKLDEKNLCKSVILKKKRFAVVIKPYKHWWNFKFPFLSAELSLLLYLRLCWTWYSCSFVNTLPCMLIKSGQYHSFNQSFERERIPQQNFKRFLWNKS